MMAPKDACSRGHKYVSGSFAWRTNGTRRCLVCERMTRISRKRAQGVKPRAQYLAERAQAAE